MPKDIQVQVPKGKVLITSSSDWFTNEIFFRSHDSRELISQENLDAGQLLEDGESTIIREKFRNDGPGEKYDYTITEIRITNKNGKAQLKELQKIIV